MPFQFMCPQGHLLEGHESQMGQQVQCPLCGTPLIIPFVGPGGAPIAPPEYHQQPQPMAAWPPAPPSAPFGYPPAPGYQPAPGYPPPPGYPQAPAYAPPPMPPQPQNAAPEPPVPKQAAAPPAAPPPPKAPDPPPAPPEPEEPKEPVIVRILCPNGHELHTPMDMIGMQAACPECNAEFLLRYEDSLEYIEKKKAARIARDDAFNTAALKWSIAAAVIVLLALIGMVVAHVMK